MRALRAFFVTHPVRMSAQQVITAILLNVLEHGREWRDLAKCAHGRGALYFTFESVEKAASYEHGAVIPSYVTLQTVVSHPTNPHWIKEVVQRYDLSTQALVIVAVQTEEDTGHNDNLVCSGVLL